jgi:hypothetical protein
MPDFGCPRPPRFSFPRRDDRFAIRGAEKRTPAIIGNEWKRLRKPIRPNDFARRRASSGGGINSKGWIWCDLVRFGWIGAQGTHSTSSGQAVRPTRHLAWAHCTGSDFGRCCPKPAIPLESADCRLQNEMQADSTRQTGRTPRPQPGLCQRTAGQGVRGANPMPKAGGQRHKSASRRRFLGANRLPQTELWHTNGRGTRGIVALYSSYLRVTGPQRSQAGGTATGPAAGTAALGAQEGPSGGHPYRCCGRDGRTPDSKGIERGRRQAGSRPYWLTALR